MRRYAKAFALGAVALTITSLGVVWAGASELPRVAATDQSSSVGSSDWPSWQRDQSGSRYNGAEGKINPTTAGQLKLKWAYTFGRVPFARVGSQPAVVDNVLYVGAPDAKFLALDAKTGATKWTFDLATGSPANGVRNGAAVVGDKVYFGDSTGRVYALYKATGKLAWVTQVEDHPTTWMTGSPTVYDGDVYIGVSTNESVRAQDPNYPCCSHRGSVVSLDARSGNVNWQFYTVPSPKEAGTWESGAKKFAPSGGSVWATPVIDPRTRTLFVGTGNNTTGQTDSTDSMLALDIDRGTLRWKNQLTFPDTYTMACDLTEVPNDYCPGKGTYALDADIGASANLINVGGRTLVVAAQKDGRLHAFDARSGQIVWQTALVPVGLGGVGVEWGTAYDGKWIYGATWDPPSKLVAVDPLTGKIVWRVDHPADGCTTGGAAQFPDLCAMSFTPAISATPGLLYEGSMDGKMRIFSSRDGALLWEFDAIRDFDGVNGVPGRGSAISGNGGAVIVDGMLYVQAGYYPFYPSEKGTVLLAFGL